MLNPVQEVVSSSHRRSIAILVDQSKDHQKGKGAVSTKMIDLILQNTGVVIEPIQSSVVRGMYNIFPHPTLYPKDKPTDLRTLFRLLYAYQATVTNKKQQNRFLRCAIFLVDSADTVKMLVASQREKQIFDYELYVESKKGVIISTDNPIDPTPAFPQYVLTSWENQQQRPQRG